MGKSPSSDPTTPLPTQQIALQFDRVLRRINARLHPAAEQFDVDRIGPLGGMTLMALADHNAPMAIAALTGEMGRDKSQMTRLVQSLEQKGYVTRAPHPDDGRVSLLSLSPAGRAFVERVGALLSEIMEELLAPLPEAERQNLLTSLAKL